MVEEPRLPCVVNESLFARVAHPKDFLAADYVEVIQFFHEFDQSVIFVITFFVLDWRRTHK